MCGNIGTRGVQSVAEKNAKEKYAYLDQLSTKELQEILRADVDSPGRGDDEAIFYILEVMEKREQEHPSGSFPDLDACWQEFQTIYHTPEGEGQSLYPAEDPEDEAPAGAAPAGKPRRRVLRRWVLAAALLALLIASLAIPVAGYDNLLEMIGHWTSEQFTFLTADREDESGLITDSEGSAETDVGAELRQVLQEHGITENVVPTWMPDGFEQTNDIFIEEYPEFGVTDFFATFSDGTDTCAVSIVKRSSYVDGNIYEKVSDNPEIYIAGNQNHYIVQNEESIIAAWYIENLECTINTTMSESDLKRAIDSIY